MLDKDFFIKCDNRISIKSKCWHTRGGRLNFVVPPPPVGLEVDSVVSALLIVDV